MAVGLPTVSGSVGKATLSGDVGQSSINPFQANLVYYAPLQHSLTTAYTDPTLTRAGTAYYSPVPTEIRSAGNNVCRFESNAALIESASTQYLLYNNDLDRDWGSSPSTEPWPLSSNIDTPTEVTSGGPWLPGSPTAWTITATSGGATAYIGQDIGANAANSASVWLKAGTSSVATVSIGKDNATALVADSGPINLTSEWKRIELECSSAGDTILIHPHSGGIFGNASAGDSIQVAMPCMFDTAFATSELLSTTTSTTRISDTLSIAAGIAPDVNNDFAVACWVQRIGATGSFQTLYRFVGETGVRQVNIINTGALQAFYGGNNQTSVSTPMSDNGWHRVLFTGGPTTFEVYVDGTQVLTQTIGTASGSYTSLDFNFNGTLFAHIRDVAIYDKYFSADDALEEYVNA